MRDQSIAPRVPGKFWFVVALVLFVVSLTAPVTLTLWHVFGQEENVLRLVAPETRKVRLERGTYTVFSDSRAVINGEVIISQGGLSGLRVVVRSARGEDIAVGPTSVSSRYSYGGQSGFGVFEFNIPEAGEYTISASYREADPRQRALLSVRKDFLGGLLGSILTAVALSVGGSMLALFIFLRTLFARRRLILQSFTPSFAQGRSARDTPPDNTTPQNTEPSQSPVQRQNK